jgi:hypothetical protein
MGLFGGAATLGASSSESSESANGPVAFTRFGGSGVVGDSSRFLLLCGVRSASVDREGDLATEVVREELIAVSSGRFSRWCGRSAVPVDCGISLLVRKFGVLEFSDTCDISSLGRQVGGLPWRERLIEVSRAGAGESW